MIPLLVAAAIACAPFAQVDAALKSMGEKIVIMGKTENGYLAIYASPDGSTFTAVTIDDKSGDEKSCVVSEGIGLKVATPGRGA